MAANPIHHGLDYPSLATHTFTADNQPMRGRLRPVRVTPASHTARSPRAKRDPKSLTTLLADIDRQLAARRQALFPTRPPTSEDPIDILDPWHTHNPEQEES
jgi:hypothetical protein